MVKHIKKQTSSDEALSELMGSNEIDWTYWNGLKVWPALYAIKLVFNVNPNARLFDKGVLVKFEHENDLLTNEVNDNLFELEQRLQNLTDSVLADLANGLLKHLQHKKEVQYYSKTPDGKINQNLNLYSFRPTTFIEWVETKGIALSDKMKEVLESKTNKSPDDGSSDRKKSTQLKLIGGLVKTLIKSTGGSKYGSLDEPNFSALAKEIIPYFSDAGDHVIHGLSNRNIREMLKNGINELNEAMENFVS